jgi:hypothetical protein
MRHSRLLPSEAVALARKLEPALRAEGRRRMAREPGAWHNTREILAARTGYSWPTLVKARAVVEAAKQDAQRWRPVLEQMDASGNVDAAYHKLLFRSTVELMSGR